MFYNKKKYNYMFYIFINYLKNDYFFYIYSYFPYIK